jgi:hypothetical protein
MIKGRLEPFYEQGSICTSLLLYQDGKEGYDALVEITEEYYIKVYNRQNKLVYEGEVIKDDFTKNKLINNWHYCLNVDWLQYGVEYRIWKSYFNKGYRAELTDSKMNEKEKYKNKLMKELMKKYNKEKKYEETLLTQNRILLKEKKELYYLLERNNWEYQKFEDEFHIILIEKYKEEEELKKSLKKVKKIEKSLSTLIDFDLPNEFKKIKKFNKFKNKHNIYYNPILMFDKEIKDDKKIKLINKFNKLEQQSELAKEKIMKEMFKKIDKIEPMILKEENETLYEYTEETNVIKVLKFSNKVISNIMR